MDDRGSANSSSPRRHVDGPDMSDNPTMVHRNVTLELHRGQEGFLRHDVWQRNRGPDTEPLRCCGSIQILAEFLQYIRTPAEQFARISRTVDRRLA